MPLIKVVPFWRSHPVEYLVRARYPRARAEGNLTFGPRNVDPARLSIQREAKEYRMNLEQLSREEILERVAEQLKLDVEAAQEEAAREEQGHVFNRPESEADFEYWAKMSYWTIDEAVALSLGKTPDSISAKHIDSLKWVSPFAKEYLAKREIVVRAKTMAQLWDSTIPAVFIAWAERMKFAVPDPLVEAVRGMGQQVADWKTLYERQREQTEEAHTQVTEKRDAMVAAMKKHSESIAKLGSDYDGLLRQKDELATLKDERIARLEARIAELESMPVFNSKKPLHARERESLPKLIIGMAIKGYGHDPKASRSPTAKEVAGDLAMQGIPLDEDTVRKYLAEARQLLPGDETEQNH